MYYMFYSSVLPVVTVVVVLSISKELNPRPAGNKVRLWKIKVPTQPVSV